MIGLMQLALHHRALNSVSTRQFSAAHCSACPLSARSRNWRFNRESQRIRLAAASLSHRTREHDRSPLVARVESVDGLLAVGRKQRRTWKRENDMFHLQKRAQKICNDKRSENFNGRRRVDMKIVVGDENTSGASGQAAPVQYCQFLSPSPPHNTTWSSKRICKSKKKRNPAKI